MKLRFGIIILFHILTNHIGFANYDDNFHELPSTGNLEDTINNYLKESEKLLESFPELSAKKSIRAKLLASKLNMKEREAFASYLLGKSKFNLDEYYEADKHLYSALLYYNILPGTALKGNILYYLGQSNYYLKRYDLALEYYGRAAKIYTKYKLTADYANSLKKIGLVYHTLNKFDEAIQYYNKALDIYQLENNKKNKADIYQNIGIVYHKKNEDDTALLYYQRAIETYKSAHNLVGIGTSYSNIGLIYLKKNQAFKAFKYFEKSNHSFSKANYSLGQLWAYNNMGNAMAVKGDYSLAERYFYESLKLSQKINSSQGYLSNYHDLSKLYSAQQKDGRALSFYQKYNTLKDSILLANSEAKIKELEELFSQESKEKEQSQQLSELQRRKLKRYATGGFLSLVILASLIIVSAFYQKEKAEKKLTINKTNLEELIEKRTKELQKQISERKIAEESDKLKSAFLANMSHEMRTPMNAIIAFSNFLREPELEEDRKEEYLDHIITAGDSLLRLVDDIIDIAKIESHQLKIFIQPTNINRLLIEVHKVHSELKGKRNRKHILFNLNIDNEYNYIVNTDGQRLKQILTNLVVNAFKYTDKGSVSLGFIPSLVDNSIIFYVSDTGVGIPADKHEFIFDRFYQLNYLKDRKTSGTGLGLAISKNLLKLLGGTIWVDSQPGKGSTFSIKIPVDSIKKQLNPGNNKEDKRITSNKIVKPGYNWNNVTILVAEDEDLNYKVLDTCLSRTRAHIIRAKDGASAVEICKNQKVDLVLMDIQMPIMDGYEATQEIKKMNNRTPIIAQTSFAMMGEKERCLQAGCDDFITKPLNIDALLKKIESFIK